MKYILVLIAALSFSSCDKLKKVADGAERLEAGMAATKEGLRKQTLAASQDVMNKKENRQALSPIPVDMMGAARSFAGAIRSDEVVLWAKNYIIKLNDVTFSDTFPWIDEGTEEGSLKKMQFILDKAADLQMITLVSGFLPDETVRELIENEVEQGAYKDMALAILRLRATFYSDVMVKAGMLDGDKKLDTVGKIEKAIEYTEKLDYLCKLSFVDQIAVKVAAFDEKKNESLSKPLDKDLALNTWKKIQEKAEKEFKAQSFSADPAENEQKVKEYAERYKLALEKIKMKIDSYSK